MFWKPTTYTVKDPATGLDEEREGLVLKKYHVFNVEQVDGIVMPELPATPPAHADADALWAACEAAGGPRVRHADGGAWFMQALDQIQLPPRALFESTEAYYGTLFHEGIHSTGHKTRLNRSTLIQAGRFGDANYGQEELVAEMGAGMLLAYAGLEPKYENSGAYLRGWLAALQGDKRLVLVAAQQAEKATRWILGDRPSPRVPVGSVTGVPA